MADLSVTAANVKIKSSTVKARVYQVAATTTAGQVLCLPTDSTTGKYALADANLLTHANSTSFIFAASGASADGYVLGVTEGDVDPGASVTKGAAYIVSTTAGGVAPASDFAGYGATVYQIAIGFAKDTSTIGFDPKYTGASTTS